MTNRFGMMAWAIALTVAWGLSSFGIGNAAEANADGTIRITFPDGTVKNMDVATYEAYFGPVPQANRDAAATAAPAAPIAAGRDTGDSSAASTATQNEGEDLLRRAREFDSRKEYDKAIPLYTQAAHLGNAAAQCILGNVEYNKSKSGNRDYSQAVMWYRKAAEQGHAEAQNNLGMRYHLGEGVNRDYGEAVYWYRKAAQQGYASAQGNLGYLYRTAKGMQDYAQAAYWYKKAAEQGNANAQDDLAYLYRKGQGVSQDYAQAAHWYRKAAEQGNADAQNNLGYLYRMGQGVNQDYAQAVYWYRKAAEQGDANAQNNLGFMYRMGMGVAQDYAEAAKWYEKAIANGNDEARANLAKLREITGGHYASSPMATSPVQTYSSQSPQGAVGSSPIHNDPTEIEAYKRQMAREYGLEVDAQGNFRGGRTGYSVFFGGRFADIEEAGGDGY